MWASGGVFVKGPLLWFPALSHRNVDANALSRCVMMTDNLPRAALLFSRSAHNRLLLGDVLRQMGLVPTSARSPLDAVFALSRGQFDVAVFASDPFRPSGDDTAAALAELVVTDGLAQEVVVDEGVMRLLTPAVQARVRLLRPLNPVVNLDHSGAMPAFL